MKIILTNMCMVYNNDMILVEDRVSKNWPGLTFPGGHVEANETLAESTIREIKEETNLDIDNLEEVGFMEWSSANGDKEITFLYKTNKFSGSLKSSNEGKVFWINKKDVFNYKLSQDFDILLKKFLK